MNGNKLSAPFYQDIADQYGPDKAIEAGYFQETKPWTQSYQSVFGTSFLTAPSSITTILQFSGAFWPFHEGHIYAIESAVNFLKQNVVLFLHVDHGEYRHSKGNYDEIAFRKSFDLLQKINLPYSVEPRIVFEDEMPNGCSRNFTRLYAEIARCNPDRKIWFIAGADRANFCLSFLNQGNCLVIGRNDEEKFNLYSQYSNDRIKFIPGKNTASASQIRMRHNASVVRDKK